MTPYAVILPALLAKKFALTTLAVGTFMVALAFDVTTLAAAVVTVIVALTASVVTILTAVGKMKAELLAQANVVASNVEVVKGHVNSMATAAVVKAAADADTISELRKQLADKDRTAALLAQSVVVKTKSDGL